MSKSERQTEEVETKVVQRKEGPGGLFVCFYLVDDGLQMVAAGLDGGLALPNKDDSKEEEEGRNGEGDDPGEGDHADPEPVEGVLVVIERHWEDGLEDDEADHCDGRHHPGNLLSSQDRLGVYGLPLNLLRRADPLLDLQHALKNDSGHRKRVHQVPGAALDPGKEHGVDKNSSY